MRCVAGRLPFVVLFYWKVTHFFSKIKARFSTSILRTSTWEQCQQRWNLYDFPGWLQFKSNCTTPKVGQILFQKKYQDPFPPTLSLVSLDHLKSIFLRRVIIFIWLSRNFIRLSWMTRCFHWKPPATSGSESQTRRLMIPWFGRVMNSIYAARDII